MSEPEYRRIANLRNAVEGIPSLMRRKYRIDEMPVRGYLRSKCWFFLKARAINVKSVLAYTSSNVFCAVFNNVFYHFQFSRFSFIIFSKSRGFASA